MVRVVVVAMRMAAGDEIVWDARHAYFLSPLTSAGCTTFSGAWLPQLLRV
jgi:hypothetical protein